MAEELIQDGVCGGNWWKPARSLFGSSPCSSAINDMGSFGWLNDELVNDLKKPCCSNANSDGKKTQQPVIDSTIKQVNQNPGMNYQQQAGIDSSQINQMDWNLKNFSTAAQNSSYPLNSASDSYTSSFLQTLYDTYSDQPQQSLSDTALATNFSSAINYPVKSDEFSLSLPKQQPVSHLRFSNNSPFSGALNDNRPSLFPSTQAQFSSSLNPSGSEANKTSIEPAFKRSRIETPSPLPTFKVRKEKLGDRITALQQLVSPFGRTDTASVLQEAIEYIRFLHNQVLNTTYTKNGFPVQGQQAADKLKDKEGPKQDLKSRGLCLVPVLSTFPVAAEIASDFWNLTFGRTIS